MYWITPSLTVDLDTYTKKFSVYYKVFFLVVTNHRVCRSSARVVIDVTYLERVITKCNSYVRL